MNNGTLDLRHGAAGYTKGKLFLIDHIHHKVIVAAIRGMQTGGIFFYNECLEMAILYLRPQQLIYPLENSLQNGNRKN